MTDEMAWLSRLALQDRAAFNTLVQRTARLIWSHLYLHCRDGHRAEDLTQETFLRAWKSIGTLQDSGRLRSWLLSIADRVFLDDGKSRTRQKRSGPTLAMDVSDHETVASPAPGPGEQSQLSEERQRMLDAMSHLPEHYRQPLLLKYVAGLELAAIATQLDQSPGAVRGQLQRGLEMLRDRLGAASKSPETSRRVMSESDE